MANVTPEKVRLSVLMSVYHAEIPNQLDQAISSIVNQTRRPDEIVIVIDGPVSSDLTKIIDRWSNQYNDVFKVVKLQENCGLGLALRAGCDACTGEIIARMDSDDISLPNRFEKQLCFFFENPDTDVLSSWVGAFSNDPDTIFFVRRGPTRHNEISALSRFRFPMNHPATMMRAEVVRQAGGYCNRPGLEDYHLWARMLLNGAKMATIPEVLYKLRCNSQLVRRRRGWTRAIRHVSLQYEFLRMGFTTIPQFIINVPLRFISSILPVWLLTPIRYFWGL